MRINICFNSIYSGEEIIKVQEKGCNVKMTPTDIQLYGKKKQMAQIDNCTRIVGRKWELKQIGLSFNLINLHKEICL